MSEERRDEPREGATDLGARERVRRATRTGSAIARVYLGYKGLKLLDRGALQPVVSRVRRVWDRSSANTLRDAAEDLGGVLLKAGQFLGARADVLPPAYVERLEHLQDRVRAHPYRVIRRVVEQELGDAPEALFARFWRRPLASASLAQVHRATLFDGREVAVKVQRPEIEGAVRADLRNLRVAARAIESIEGDLGYGMLLDQLENNLERELDFVLEAQSAMRLAANFSADPRVRVPAVIPTLVRRRLLVTEYIPGIKITDVKRLRRSGIDPSEIARALLDAFAAQILEHHFFHGDPHPGNLLVVPGEDGAFELAFLDFGLMQEVPQDFRARLVELAGRLMSGDVPGVADALIALGLETRNPESDTVLRAAELLVELLRRAHDEGWDRTTRDIGQRLADLLRADPVASIPPHLWLLGRVFGLLTGVSTSLGARIDMARELLPWLAGQKRA